MNSSWPTGSWLEPLLDLGGHLGPGDAPAGEPAEQLDQLELPVPDAVVDRQDVRPRPGREGEGPVRDRRIQALAGERRQPPAALAARMPRMAHRELGEVRPLIELLGDFPRGLLVVDGDELQLDPVALDAVDTG